VNEKMEEILLTTQLNSAALLERYQINATEVEEAIGNYAKNDVRDPNKKLVLERVSTIIGDFQGLKALGLPEVVSYALDASDGVQEVVEEVLGQEFQSEYGWSNRTVKIADRTHEDYGSDPRMQAVMQELAVDESLNGRGPLSFMHRALDIMNTGRSKTDPVKRVMGIVSSFVAYLNDPDYKWTAKAISERGSGAASTVHSALENWRIDSGKSNSGKQDIPELVEPSAGELEAIKAGIDDTEAPFRPLPLPVEADVDDKVNEAETRALPRKEVVAPRAAVEQPDQLSTLRKQVESLISQLTTVAAERDDLQSRVEILEAQVGDTAKVAELEAKLREVTDKYDGLKAEHTTYRGDIAALSEMLSRYSKEGAEE